MGAGRKSKTVINTYFEFLFLIVINRDSVITMLLTEEEVQNYLGVDRLQIEKLMKRGKLTAFRVGGSYLRFQKEEVMAIKAGKRFVPADQLGRSWTDRARDFWKFYGFYVLSSVLIALAIILIFQYL